MNDIQIVSFDPYTQIRTATDEQGRPLVCASDVCRELGLKKPADAYQRIDPDYKVSVSNDTLGGKQEMLFLTEEGVYDIMLSVRLRKDNLYYNRLKALRRWICTYVLPS